MSDLPQPPHGNAPLASWASWAADVGRITRAFKVFPVVPGGKTPRFGGWQGAASWDRKTVEATWTDHEDSNVGLAIQPGFVVLDADIYKSGNEALLSQFEAEYGALPPTLEFCSARGGFHLIYSTLRLLGNGVGSLPKFGDVRGHGGLIVGPGSMFEGKPYTVAEVAMPVPLPTHVDACLMEKRGTTSAERTPPPGVLMDDPLNIARYTQWLLTDARLGISGVDGNNTLAATAAMGASYALTEDETIHLLVEHWNSRQDEPWQPEQIERFGGSGYRSSTSKFGNMAATNPKALGFKDQTEGKPTQASGDVWRTMADITGPAPPRLWALGTDADGWVPLGGVTLLYGAGGTGKTALVGQWALAQSRGEPLFGMTTRKMPVVLVAAEDGADELHRRFEAQGRRADDQVSFAAVRGMDTAFHPSFKKEGAEDTWLFSLVDHKLASMPAGPKMLFLDNLGQLYQGNYVEQAEIMRFINGYLGRLAEKHEATIIVLAHPSESQRASGDGGMGGVGWSAGVRARLYFERHMTKATKLDRAKPIGRERVFSRKKANYADDGERDILLDWDNWKFVPIERAACPFQSVVEVPMVPKARRNSVAEGAVLPIVQAAVEAALASNPTKRWNALDLATDASYRLGQGPNKLVPDTIRKIYLPQMIANAHPAYNNAGKEWRHVTLH